MHPSMVKNGFDVLCHFQMDPSLWLLKATKYKIVSLSSSQCENHSFQFNVQVSLHIRRNGILVNPDERLIFLKVKKVPGESTMEKCIQSLHASHNQLKRFYHIVLSTKVELIAMHIPMGKKEKASFQKQQPMWKCATSNNIPFNVTLERKNHYLFHLFSFISILMKKHLYLIRRELYLGSTPDTEGLIRFRLVKRPMEICYNWPKKSIWFYLFYLFTFILFF